MSEIPPSPRLFLLKPSFSPFFDLFHGLLGKKINFSFVLDLKKRKKTCFSSFLDLKKG
jgi:hypothetical protein